MVMCALFASGSSACYGATTPWLTGYACDTGFRELVISCARGGGRAPRRQLHQYETDPHSSSNAMPREVRAAVAWCISTAGAGTLSEEESEAYVETMFDDGRGGEESW